MVNSSILNMTFPCTPLVCIRSNSIACLPWTIGFGLGEFTLIPQLYFHLVIKQIITRGHRTRCPFFVGMDINRDNDFPLCPHVCRCRVKKSQTASFRESVWPSLKLIFELCVDVVCRLPPYSTFIRSPLPRTHRPPAFRSF